MKDMAKRKRVMQRSIRLGHCICDPKKSCPCDVLREKDVCPCAGERLEGPAGQVRLTDLVDSPGCASKIDEASLKKVLQGLPQIDDPRVLVGVPAGDDAGVYKLDGDLALVQTVDVFSPSVDDPYVFGQIAAANSLSDVYAMGARPIAALSVVGFPIREVPDRVMRELLRGGIDKMAEAGVAVIGGHSINDQQIKAGFAVTGLVHPDKIVTNAKAQPGDRLILTKPLGIGIMAFAAQIGRAPAGGPEAAARTMATLNRRASELMIEFDAHACTDVTGFGLAGHLAAMASAGNVDVEIVWDDLPLLEGVLQCAADGVLPGAIERNRESSADRVVGDAGVEPPMLDICFDAQTSGGLLIAVGESQADPLLEKLHAEGVSEAAIVGKVLGEGSGRVFVRHAGRRQMPVTNESAPAAVVAAPQAQPAGACCAEQETNEVSCCEGSHESAGDAAANAEGAAEIQRKFQEFMKAAARPGALDAAAKQAIAVALSVLAKCEPCVKAHIKKARQMGFSQEEIDEAAWMAVLFGGSPAMMFYNQFRRS
ncbi:selenide, water dikinase SelD [Planctomycetota bacterium]